MVEADTICSLSTAWLFAFQTIGATVMVGAVLDPDKTQATPGEQCCLLDGHTFRLRPRVRVKSIHENSVEPESCLSIL